MPHHFNCSNPADCWCEVRRLLTVMLVTMAILAFEVVGGLLSGSLALLADAGHVLIDNAAVTIAIMAALLVKRGFDQSRVRAIAFYSNIALLWCVVGWILFEAFDRFSHPESIRNNIMIAVAVIGGLGNFVQKHILEKAPDEHKHQVHKTLSLHVRSDLIQSGGVVGGGILILLTEWVVIDPILSVGIAVWITCQIVKLMRNQPGLVHRL